jgi:hypothetical protein
METANSTMFEAIMEIAWPARATVKPGMPERRGRLFFVMVQNHIRWVDGETVRHVTSLALMMLWTLPTLH